MSLRVNATVLWILVILNILCIAYLFIVYLNGGDMPFLIKRIQEGLTFTIWVILISDIFVLKVKDRWFWAISVTILLPIAAPVYLWRRRSLETSLSET